MREAYFFMAYKESNSFAINADIVLSYLSDRSHNADNKYIDVCFQVAKILNEITYTAFNIARRLAQVPFFYSLTLTFIFKVNILTIFLFLRISGKQCEREQT